MKYYTRKDNKTYTYENKYDILDIAYDFAGIDKPTEKEFDYSDFIEFVED